MLIATSFLTQTRGNADRSSTICEIRTYSPRIGDQQALAGARATGVEEVARQPAAGEAGLGEGWFRALAHHLSRPSEDRDLARLDVARTQSRDQRASETISASTNFSATIPGSGPRRIDIVWRVSCSPSTSTSFAGNASENRRIFALVR